MQTLIVTVVFHTRHCFELHRGNANRDLRVEAAKRPEDGAKWREIGGYAVCRIRQSHPEIDATNPHWRQNAKGPREGCVHHVRKHWLGRRGIGLKSFTITQTEP